MGLFAKRPQQEETATVLPGEPLVPESAAERLADSAPVDAGAIGPLGTVASIAVPLPVEEPEGLGTAADS